MSDSELTADQAARAKRIATDVIARTKLIQPLSPIKIGGYRRNFAYSYQTTSDGSVVQTAVELPPTFDGKPYES